MSIYIDLQQIVIDFFGRLYFVPTYVFVLFLAYIFASSLLTSKLNKKIEWSTKPSKLNLLKGWALWPFYWVWAKEAEFKQKVREIVKEMQMQASCSEEDFTKIIW